MKKLALITLSALASVWFTQNLSAQEVTINFDLRAYEVHELSTSPYSEEGFLFTQWSGSGSEVSSSFADLLVFGTVRITRIDGGLFDLLSLDVREPYIRDALGAFDLETSKGGTQILEEEGSYSFSGSEFEGLRWVDLINTRGPSSENEYVVDTIVLAAVPGTAAVPEPSTTFLLIGSGALAFAFFRRRFRKE